MEPDSGPPPESVALPGPRPADGALRVDVAEGERYPTVGVLGRGGMGRVTAVRDERLGRTVARKEALPGHEARLVEEASLAARLEHPGIVAVLDAGRTVDGRPFYTMTLGTGRTLFDALGERRTAASRRPLVRTVLLAAEAVAHAHRRGVVHRDLKPSNLLLGELGGVQVSDWGLAAEVGAPGAGEGTEGWASPEQRGGAAADPRTDVWSLGVLLREVLRDADDTGDDLPSAPAELRAIVRRACAPVAGERYADAGALAADLAAWFDGDRVDAHDYSTVEQLFRTLRAWRLPLLLAAVGLAAGGVATALSFSDMRRARDAAVAANDRATAALADALAVEAASAESRGAWSDAAALARRSLQTRPTAAARGVLASVAAADLTPLRSRARVDDCVSMVPAPDGAAWLCLGVSALTRWDVGAARPTWSAHPAREAAWSTEGVVLARDAEQRTDTLLDAGDGRVLGVDVARDGFPWLVQGHGPAAALVELGEMQLRTRQGVVRRAVPCDHLVSAGWSTDGASLWVACRDGRVLARGLEGDFAERVRVEDALRDVEVTAVTGWADGSAMLGMFDGRLIRLDASGRVLSVEQTGLGTLRQIVGPAEGTWAAIRGERGGVVILDRRTAVVRHRLPESARGALVVGEDDRTLTSLAATQATTWRIESEGPLLRTTAAAGVSAGAWLDDGHGLALAHGDGSVRAWDVDRGGVPTVYAWQPSVVKGLVAHGGGVLAAVTDGAALIPLVEGEVGEGVAVAEYGVRRLGRVGDAVWAASYTESPAWWTGGTVRALPVPRVLDGADAPSRAAAAFLTDDGVWRIDAEGRATRLPIPELADVGPVALADDGRVALAVHRRVRVWSPDGSERVLEVDAAVLDLAWSVDGWLAAGTRDGTLVVWDDVGAPPSLVHRAHADRISWLAFSGDGRRLATASWDGSARIWTMPPRE